MIAMQQARDIRGRKLPTFTATLGGFFGTGASKSEATEALHARIAAFETRRQYLFTGSGDVLAVYQGLAGDWGYDICAADRKWPSGCWGLKSFDDAVAAARDHAQQSYNGVTGEN